MLMGFLGKSTLAMSLLRMIEAADGRIMSVHSFLPPDDVPDLLFLSSVDGVDISKLGLEDLRRSVVCSET